MNITVSGNPKIVDQAPTDALKKQLETLLAKTSASTFNLEIIRRLPPGRSVGVLIQHQAKDGVQVSIQVTTPSEARNYRCILSSNTLRDNELMNEILAAAKDLAGVAVAAIKKPKHRKHRAVKAKKSAKISGLSLNDDNVLDVLQSIQKTFNGADSANAVKISKGLMKDLTLHCQKRGLGIVYRTLRKWKLLQVVDDRIPKTYGFTTKALSLLAGTSPSRLKPAKEQALPPLQKQLAILEESEARLAALQNEIAAGEEVLVAKRAEAEKLKSDISVLGEVKKILFTSSVTSPASSLV